MSYPTHEEDYDREEQRDRQNLRIVGKTAAQTVIEDEKLSQLLVDSTIQKEQKEYFISPPIQDHPGEPESLREMDSVEEAMATTPQKMYNPATNPLIERTTVSRRLKKMLGVPSIRSRGGITEFKERSVAKSQPAQGHPVTGRVTPDTPVKSLNLLDQFFNWVNAFLK